MRKLVAAVVVCALLCAVEGAPKLAKSLRGSDVIHFNRDTAFVNHQRPSRPALLTAPPERPRGPDSRGVFTASADDYEQIVATGVNSVEGLIQDSNFAPGLIYSGSPDSPTGYPDGPLDGAPQEETAVLPTGSPVSRCILCGGGSCPDCYQLDHSGVCRTIYGCQ